MVASEWLAEQNVSVAMAWLSFIDVRVAQNRVSPIGEIVKLEEQVEFAVPERLAQGVAGEPELLTVRAELALMPRQLLP